MTTTSTLDSTPAATVPICIPPVKLAPPFGSGWSRIVNPVPRGYNGSAQLDSARGTGLLHLGAKPHPPTAPTTIGWFGAGWRSRVSVQLATNFVATARCNDVVVAGGGVFVPRLFVVLRPVAGGPEIVGSAVLAEGHTSFVSLTVPQCPYLPAPAFYDLEVSFSIRAVYSKAQNPQGCLFATISSVTRGFAFPTATAETQGLLDLAAFVPEAEAADLDLADLEAMLAGSSGAKLFPIESDLAAFAAGLETLEA